MELHDRRPLVGVGVWVRRPNGMILMGRRMGSHGAGTWSIPGGLIEPDEDVAMAATRELKEETSIDVQPLQVRTLYLPGALDFHEKPWGRQAYITLYGLVDVPDATTAIVCEPHKCAEWTWVKAPHDVPGGLARIFSADFRTLTALGLTERADFVEWVRSH